MQHKLLHAQLQRPMCPGGQLLRRPLHLRPAHRQQNLPAGLHRPRHQLPNPQQLNPALPADRRRLLLQQRLLLPEPRSPHKCHLPHLLLSTGLRRSRLL